MLLAPRLVPLLLAAAGTALLAAGTATLAPAPVKALTKGTILLTPFAITGIAAASAGPGKGPSASASAIPPTIKPTPAIRPAT